MSDHNFEKQIRQKLDELKIPPADTVWSSVETQIRKDKRRRRGLILFPMLLLLIGAGAYFTFENNLPTNNSGSKYVATSDGYDKTDNANEVLGNTNNSDKNNDDADLSNEAETKEETLKAGPLNDEANELTQKRESRNRNKEEDNKTKTSPNQKEARSANDYQIIDKTPSSNAEPDLAVSSNNRESVQKKTIKAEKRIAPPTVRDKKRNDRDAVVENEIVTIDNKREEQLKKGDRGNAGQLILQSKKENAKETSMEEETQKKDEIVKKDQENITIPDSLANKAFVDAGNNPPDATDSNNVVVGNKPADSASSSIVVEKKNAAVKKIKSSSWKWGLTGSGGVSNMNDGSFFDGIIDGFISGEKALVADVSPNAMNSAPSPTAIIYKPSAIEKGFSFSIGAFVQKNLSKRFSIASGLQYSYYSTKIEVGRRVDSATILQNAFGSLNVSQFYRAAPVPSTYEYTNRFHFIELPVTTNLQLSRRLPVYWHAGLSLSYLVSTNALHFDSQTGVYYKDNDLLNRLQANLSTGLSISLWSKSNTPVHVGPQLQYGLTNLMKKDVSAAKHLFYFGLNTRVFLKK